MKPLPELGRHRGGRLVVRVWVLRFEVKLSESCFRRLQILVDQDAKDGRADRAEAERARSASSAARLLQWQPRCVEAHDSVCRPVDVEDDLIEACGLDDYLLNRCTVDLRAADHMLRPERTRLTVV